MLTVTDAARARLMSKLGRGKGSQDAALRFMREENGWRLRRDRARPGDMAFTFEGRKVLVLNIDVARGMAALTLDARDTASGVRLRLTTPPGR